MQGARSSSSGASARGSPSGDPKDGRRRRPSLRSRTGALRAAPGRGLSATGLRVRAQTKTAPGAQAMPGRWRVDDVGLFGTREGHRRSRSNSELAGAARTRPKHDRRPPVRAAATAPRSRPAPPTSRRATFKCGGSSPLQAVRRTPDGPRRQRHRQPPASTRTLRHPTRSRVLNCRTERGSGTDLVVVTPLWCIRLDKSRNQYPEFSLLPVCVLSDGMDYAYPPAGRSGCRHDPA